MKIAIQGHQTRGKEVIQILESLGGKNLHTMTGSTLDCAYYINDSYNIDGNPLEYVKQVYPVYTLEEFEKEFPFKIGDKVKHISSICTIRKYCYINNKPCYEVKSMELGIIATIPVKLLEPYEEMEIRNITLTLDKAKEWYKKGGELKEIALQAYSEKELNSRPITWEEFCKNNPLKTSEAVICTESTIVTYGCSEIRDPDCDRQVCPSKKSAEAHLALIQLEQLRDCWRQGWEPIWDISEKWCIRLWGNELSVGITTNISRFLTFPTKEMAEDFLKCFKDLIEKAGDLI